MTAPYRNEIDALRERKAALEQEAAHLRTQTSYLDAMRAREAEIAREIAAIDAKVGTRALPMLDQVRVASPCNESWGEMVGDERVRFCLKCEKNVYNLSAMTREAAEQLLRERAGGELCVRFYQRTDGTVLTEDCPVGVTKKRRKKVALAVAGAGAMAFAAVTALEKRTCQVQGQMQGAVAMMGDVGPAPTSPPVMGSAAPQALPPPQVTPPAPVQTTRVMGKMMAPRDVK